MAGGSQSFFQVAVGLIPGLIFGGALLERRSGQTRAVAELPPWMRGVIVVFLLVGVVAQVIAIRGAIEPGVPTSQQYVVVGVVVAGTIGIAFMTVWVLGLLPERSSWRARMLVCAATVAAVASAVVALSGSIDRADARLALNEASERSIRYGTELSAANAERREARSALIATTAEGRPLGVPPARKLELGRVLRRYMYDLDGISVSDEEITRPHALEKPFDVLNKASRRANEAIRALRISSSSEDLVLLTVERVSSAEAARLTAAANAAFSRKSVDDACRDAEVVGCRISSR